MSTITFIMAAGVLQGFLLSIILLKRTERNKIANRWLSAFILVNSLLSLSDVLGKTFGSFRLTGTNLLFDWCVLLIGPLMLTYVMEMTGERYSYRNGWFLHFLPAAIFLLFSLLVYSFQAELQKTFPSDRAADQLKRAPDAVDVFFAIQIGFYFLWSGLVLRKYSRSLREHYSDLKHRYLRWLKTLIGISLGLWTLFVIWVLTSSSLALLLNDIGFPVVAYLLGYFSLVQVDLSGVQKEFSIDQLDSAAPSIDTERDGNALNSREGDRYVRSGFKKENVAKLKQDLEQYMSTEKPYLNHDLKLHELAEKLGVPPHHLSQLLNEYYGKNFFDFVNTYRAVEAQNMLSDPGNQGDSILSIAFNSGFNSKATFNSFFKKHTGQTPRQFRSHYVPNKIEPS